MATRPRKLVEPTEQNTPTARDREMGREGEPLGDLGQADETWKPPAGEQGLSNRPDDEATSPDRNPASRDTNDEQDALGDDDGFYEDEFEVEGESAEDDESVDEEDTN